MPPNFENVISHLEGRFSKSKSSLLQQLWDITTQHAVFHAISKIALNRNSCLNNRYLKQLIVYGHTSRHCMGIRSILFDHQNDTISLHNTLDFLDKNRHVLKYGNFEKLPGIDGGSLFAKFSGINRQDCKKSTLIPYSTISDLKTQISSVRAKVEPYIVDNFAHKKENPRIDNTEWHDLDEALSESWKIYLKLRSIRYDGAVSPIGLHSGDILHLLKFPALDADVDPIIFREEVHKIICAFTERYSHGEVRIVSRP